MRTHMGDNPDITISINMSIEGDLKRLSHPYFNYLLQSYDQYSKNGVLPFTGSLAEQPAQIIEAFEIIAQLNYEREKIQIEEAKRK